MSTTYRIPETQRTNNTDRLQRQIRELRGRVADHQRWIDQNQPRLSKLLNQLAALADIKNVISGATFEAAGLDTFYQGAEVEHSSLNNMTERVQREKDSLDGRLAASQKQLSQVAQQERMAALKPAKAEPVLNLADITSRLETFPQIKNVGWQVLDYGHQLQLTIDFHPMTMMPADDSQREHIGNFYAILGNLGDKYDYGFPSDVLDCDKTLAETRLLISISNHGNGVTTTASLYPKHEEDSYYRRPHPHWLSDAPCMGDYELPFYDALSDYDFETAIAVILEFLQTYNVDDSAGMAGTLWGPLFHKAHNQAYAIRRTHDRAPYPDNSEEIRFLRAGIVPDPQLPENNQINNIADLPIEILHVLFDYLDFGYRNAMFRNDYTLPSDRDTDETTSDPYPDPGHDLDTGDNEVNYTTAPDRIEYSRETQATQRRLRGLAEVLRGESRLHRMQGQQAPLIIVDDHIPEPQPEANDGGNSDA